MKGPPAMPTYSPQRLRDARVSAGLSRDQAAQRAGRTVATVTAYEQGGVTPTVAILGRLATIYSVGVETLFDADDPADAVTAFAAEITRLVDTAPPLSAAARSNLRTLLRGVV